MNCHAGWNAEFLDAHFPEAFRKGSYKKHMESVLLDREKAWMPGTMVHVQARREEQQRQAEIDLLHGEIQRLRQRVLELQIQGHNASHVAPRPAQNRVACRCPAADCRGFVLQRDWTCGVCSARVCATCMEHLKEGVGAGGEHTCKPENVETANLLRRDSRACPKCATLIFRISGCNQMWCTACNTAFDWRTGEIESRLDRVHNPHYFEWLRQSQGGAAPSARAAAGEGGCAGAQNVPPPYSFSQYVARHMPLTSPLAVRLMNAHRMILHMQHVLLPRLRTGAPQPPENINLDLRIRYMSNEMTEEAFQKAIYKRAVLNEKNNTHRQLLHMFTQCAIDIMRRAMGNGTPAAAYESLEELRRFYNDGVSNFRTRFRTQQYIRINEHWEECK